jgi:DNA repair ATPase RecN
MSIDIQYVLNMAYQELSRHNTQQLRDCEEWMGQLHTLAQQHFPRVQQLASERETCTRTVRQLQDHIDILRRTNKRYAQRIIDTDIAINTAMENIDKWADEPFDTDAIEEAHAILDRALTNFPVELIPMELDLESTKGIVEGGQ